MVSTPPIGAGYAGARNLDALHLRIERQISLRAKTERIPDLLVFFHHFAIGAAAAAAFEALKLWEIRGKLTEAKFRKLIRSTTL